MADIKSMLPPEDKSVIAGYGMRVYDDAKNYLIAPKLPRVAPELPEPLVMMARQDRSGHLVRPGLEEILVQQGNLVRSGHRVRRTASSATTLGSTPLPVPRLPNHGSSRSVLAALNPLQSSLPPLRRAR